MPARSVVAALKMDLKVLSRTVGEQPSTPRLGATPKNQLAQPTCARSARRWRAELITISNPTATTTANTPRIHGDGRTQTQTLQGETTCSTWTRLRVSAVVRLIDRAAHQPPTALLPQAEPRTVGGPTPTRRSKLTRQRRPLWLRAPRLDRSHPIQAHASTLAAGRPV